MSWAVEIRHMKGNLLEDLVATANHVQCYQPVMGNSQHINA